MTEAVILALIALVGVLIFCIASIIIVKVIQKSDPKHLKFSNIYGQFEVDFNARVDE